MSQQFCLKWNNHMNNMMDVFKNLLSTEAMVDVTLACDGLSLKAHKIVLSACSPFFQSLFLENPCKHPIVILKDMKYNELKAIIEFMYHGEVNVAQDQLSALMKTAETLRVKGLAEVTNEKNNSQSSNVPQDDSGHRSVPRTDTPPPKRRRGRTRKRSLSDSNRSDDDSTEPKIKQPDSPEIEELSGDLTMDATSGQYSIQSQVPMQTLPSHSTNSFHKSSVSQQDQQPVVEDPGSADESFATEEKFGVEPSKLLEQTLTTDDLPNARRTGRSSVPSGMEMQRRPRSSTDHSTALVPTSMPSEALGSNQQPESPPDIKPELLELDPPMSPVAGPSHSTDNSMMMYMDQSSMSALPGPSGYQDNSALVSQDSQQPQELNAFMQTINGSIPRSSVPTERRCSFGVLHYGDEIFQGRHMPDQSSSHHNPQPRDVFTDISGRDQCVGFSQGEPICTTTLSKAISHQENPSRMENECKIAMQLNLTVHDERSRVEFHKPQHAASLTGKKPLTLTSPNEQLVQQNYFPQRQNNSQYRSPLASSDHHEERISQDLNLQREAVLLRGAEFVCSVCNLKLPSYAKLQQHEEMHKSERSSTYNICYKKFTGNNELLQHNESRTRKRSYSCAACDKKFSYNSYLLQHQLTHTGERPYKCDSCVYASATKGNLIVHQRKHTGERPFKCKFCQYESAQSSNLKAHIRVRHETHGSLSSETSTDSLTS